MQDKERWVVADALTHPRQARFASIEQAVFNAGGSTVFRVVGEAVEAAPLADVAGAGDPKEAIAELYKRSVIVPARGEALAQARIVGRELLGDPGYDPDHASFRKTGASLPEVVYFNALERNVDRLREEFSFVLRTRFETSLGREPGLISQAAEAPEEPAPAMMVA